MCVYVFILIIYLLPLSSQNVSWNEADKLIRLTLKKL